DDRVSRVDCLAAHAGRIGARAGAGGAERARRADRRHALAYTPAQRRRRPRSRVVARRYGRAAQVDARDAAARAAARHDVLDPHQPRVGSPGPTRSKVPGGRGAQVRVDARGTATAMIVRSMWEIAEYAIERLM